MCRYHHGLVAPTGAITKSMRYRSNMQEKQTMDHPTAAMAMSMAMAPYHDRSKWDISMDIYIKHLRVPPTPIMTRACTYLVGVICAMDESLRSLEVADWRYINRGDTRDKTYGSVVIHRSYPPTSRR